MAPHHPCCLGLSLWNSINRKGLSHAYIQQHQPLLIVGRLRSCAAVQYMLQCCCCSGDRDITVGRGLLGSSSQVPGHFSAWEV